MAGKSVRIQDEDGKIYELSPEVMPGEGEWTAGKAASVMHEIKGMGPSGKPLYGTDKVNVTFGPESSSITKDIEIPHLPPGEDPKTRGAVELFSPSTWGNAEIPVVSIDPRVQSNAKAIPIKDIGTGIAGGIGKAADWIAEKVPEKSHTPFGDVSIRSETPSGGNTLGPSLGALYEDFQKEQARRKSGATQQAEPPVLTMDPSQSQVYEYGGEQSVQPKRETTIGNADLRGPEDFKSTSAIAIRTLANVADEMKSPKMLAFAALTTPTRIFKAVHVVTTGSFLIDMMNGTAEGTEHIKDLKGQIAKLREGGRNEDADKIERDLYQNVIPQTLTSAIFTLLIGKGAVKEIKHGISNDKLAQDIKDFKSSEATIRVLEQERKRQAVERAPGFLEPDESIDVDIAEATKLREKSDAAIQKNLASRTIKNPILPWRKEGQVKPGRQVPPDLAAALFEQKPADPLDFGYERPAGMRSESFTVTEADTVKDVARGVKEIFDARDRADRQVPQSTNLLPPAMPERVGIGNRLVPEEQGPAPRDFAQQPTTPPVPGPDVALLAPPAANEGAIMAQEAAEQARMKAAFPPGPPALPPLLPERVGIGPRAVPEAQGPAPEGFAQQPTTRPVAGPETALLAPKARDRYFAKGSKDRAANRDIAQASLAEDMRARLEQERANARPEGAGRPAEFPGAGEQPQPRGAEAVGGEVPAADVRPGGEATVGGSRPGIDDGRRAEDVQRTGGPSVGPRNAGEEFFGEQPSAGRDVGTGASYGRLDEYGRPVGELAKPEPTEKRSTASTKKQKDGEPDVPLPGEDDLYTTTIVGDSIAPRVREGATAYGTIWHEGGAKAWRRAVQKHGKEADVVFGNAGVSHPFSMDGRYAATRLAGIDSRIASVIGDDSGYAKGSDFYRALIKDINDRHPGISVADAGKMAANMFGRAGYDSYHFVDGDGYNAWATFDPAQHTFKPRRSEVGVANAKQYRTYLGDAFARQSPGEGDVATRIIDRVYKKRWMEMTGRSEADFWANGAPLLGRLTKKKAGGDYEAVTREVYQEGESAVRPMIGEVEGALGEAGTIIHEIIHAMEAAGLLRRRELEGIEAVYGKDWRSNRIIRERLAYDMVRFLAHERANPAVRELFGDIGDIIFNEHSRLASRMRFDKKAYLDRVDPAFKPVFEALVEGKEATAADYGKERTRPGETMAVERPSPSPDEIEAAFQKVEKEKGGPKQTIEEKLREERGIGPLAERFGETMALERTHDEKFIEWFGESVVKDKDGEPLTVYHGTSKDMDFQKFKIGQRGSWFTEDPESASKYAMENDSMYLNHDTIMQKKHRASRVIPAYLSIEKPYDPTPADMERLKHSNSYAATQRDIFLRAKANGYDGVRMPGGVWVVFKDTQIKSPFNSGLWGKENPNVLALSSPKGRTAEELGIQTGKKGPTAEELLGIETRKGKPEDIPIPSGLAKYKGTTPKDAADLASHEKEMKALEEGNVKVAAGVISRTPLKNASVFEKIFSTDQKSALGRSIMRRLMAQADRSIVSTDAAIKVYKDMFDKMAGESKDYTPPDWMKQTIELGIKNGIDEKWLRKYGSNIEFMAIMDDPKMGVDAIKDPALRAFAVKARRDINSRLDEIEALGGLDNRDKYLESYWQHNWDNKAEEVEKAINKWRAGRPTISGSKAFMKERKIPTYREGIALGLRPADANPIVTHMSTLRQMEKYLTGLRLMDALDKHGEMVLVKHSEDDPVGYRKPKDPLFQKNRPDEFEENAHYNDVRAGLGYERIKKGNRAEVRYVVPNQIADLLDNYVSTNRLEEIGGKAYRGLRNSANLMVAARLGGSLFHLGFVLNDAANSGLSNAAMSLTKGDIKGAANSLFNAIPVIGATRNLLRGNEIRKAWLGDNEASPEALAIAKFIELGGGRAMQDRTFWENRVIKLSRSWKKKDAKGVAVNSFYALPEMISYMVMEHFVPRVKLGVAADMAMRELAALGKETGKKTYDEVFATVHPDRIAQIAGKAWDSVDNRLGQVVYDNLFWTKTNKAFAHLMVQSVGWNLGTIRELGGGVKDLVRLVQPEVDITGKKMNRLTDRSAYMLTLPIYTAILGGILNYVNTGQPPQDADDLYFPRTGKMNPDGTPQRIAPPTYMKDVFSFFGGFIGPHGTPARGAKRMSEVVSHKLNPIWSTLVDYYKNEDFYGRQVRSDVDELKDPKDYLKFVYDTAMYAVKSFLPYGIQGYNRERQAAGTEEIKPVGKVGDTKIPNVPAHALKYVTSPSFFGYQPAPASVVRTPFMASLSEAVRKTRGGTMTLEQASRSDLKRDILTKMRAGQTDEAEATMEEARQGYLLAPREMKRLGKDARTSAIQKNLSKLSLDKVLEIYKLGDEKEREEALPAVIKKFKAARSGQSDELYRMSPEKRQQTLEEALDIIQAPPPEKKKLTGIFRYLNQK